MANDCLKTELKGGVSNNTLPTMDYISFYAELYGNITNKDLQQTISMSFAQGKTGTISVTSPGAVNGDSTTVDESTNTSYPISNLSADAAAKVSFKNASYKILINNKYDFCRFNGRGENLSTKKPIFKVNLSEFAYATSLKDLNLMFFDVVGNIRELKNCPSAQVLRFDRTNAMGNIEDLGELIGLTRLTISYSTIKGDLATFAAKQVAAGRTSGTIAFTSSEFTTINGTIIGQNVGKTITFDSSLPNGYSIS